VFTACLKNKYFIKQQIIVPFNTNWQSGCQESIRNEEN
jgi:hypothetical protein